jgi:hypothetical protein
MNGKLPKSEKSNQPKLTIIYPSRLEMFFSAFLVKSHANPPAHTVVNPAITKTETSDSSYIKATGIESIIKRPSITSRNPSVFAIMRRFNISLIEEFTNH